MKIVLLVLSGDASAAEQVLRQRFPDAAIEALARDVLETSRPAQQIQILRRLHPDIMAVASERLVWQNRQIPLLCLGALAGARRVMLFDAHGDSREGNRTAILGTAPLRLLTEALFSGKSIARTNYRLGQLERTLKSRGSTTLEMSATRLDPIRIAYLRGTPCAGTASGGASTHISGFLDAARALGAEVNLISNDYIAGVDREKTRFIAPDPRGITRAAFDLGNNLTFSKGALKAIQETHHNLIYQRYSRFTWAGIEASLKTNLPLFLEFNGSEVWMGKYWDKSGMVRLLQRFETLNLAAAERIFVVSEVDQRNLLRAGVPEHKIIVNPNGVDTERFRPGIGGSEARRELGIREDEVVAGFVGTFGPWHGVLTLAKAIALLPAEVNACFVLVGSGQLRDEVDRIVRSAGRAHKVIFTGQVEHDRVPVLLDACDILLSPHVPMEDGSEFFGSPTKLYEYMAMGKGIIASRLGQIGDVLDDEETALLFTPGDAQQLSDAIVRLSSSRSLRERLGAAARQRAIERHTWKQNAARVIDAYREWVETNAADDRGKST